MTKRIKTDQAVLAARAYDRDPSCAVCGSPLARDGAWRLDADVLICDSCDSCDDQEA